MTQRRTWWKVAAATASAMVLAACGTAAADTAADAGDEGGSGGNEAVAVHGDWEISVYDADGTLDEHVEFANALMVRGQETLASLLARTTTVGAWYVLFVANGDLCGSASTCFIAESTYNGSSDSDDLVLTQPTAETVLLAGSVEATNAATITDVGTGMEQCDGSTSAADCAATDGAFGAAFTATSITPIPVEAGQLVQVDVTLSFTTG